jgi:diguanylate cyclase (GGDEF)-like protein/PAS domain S-box-containing protein
MTEQERSEELGRVAEPFRVAFEQAPIGMALVSPDARWLRVNEALCRLTGHGEHELVGSSFSDITHPDDRPRSLEAQRRLVDGDQMIKRLRKRYVRADGSVVWVAVTSTMIRSSVGEPLYSIAQIEDISPQVQADEELRLSEQRYRDLFENARDAIYTADAAGNFLSVNRAAAEISGYTRDELLQMNFFDLIAPEDAARAGDVLARSFAGQDDEIVELQLVAKDGHPIFIEVSGRVVKENGQPVRAEGIGRNTTDRHDLQEQLTYQAFHDSLTGLPNRALLLDRLSQALARSERDGSQVAVMLLDLDNFKLVNDSLGHHVGDDLLVAIAPKLSELMRGSDTIARQGGDEFAFVIEAFADERELVTIAERVTSMFAHPFPVEAVGPQRVSASLGIALNHPGENAEDLLRNADTAMYRAKQQRRGSFEFYDDGMRKRVLRELRVRNALADAIENRELQLYYQPIVSLTDGQVLSLEALVRWQHPQWGWVSPTEFVALAESDGQIISLGDHVLTDAIAQTALWKERYPEALPLGVSVNISARQLAKPGFVDFVFATLATHQVAAADLRLEITERVFLDERDDLVIQNLRDLAAMGVGFSLDDFGTGYSALASLKRFPFTTLKIDRYFIRSIRRPTDAAPISTAIITLGRTLGLTVVAEGVENQIQADYLRRLGCPAAQGFYFARPQPADQVTRYLISGAGEFAAEWQQEATPREAVG